MPRRIPLPDGLSDGPFHVSRASGLVGEKRLRGKDLDRPFPGIRVVTGTVTDLESRCRAYAQRMPDGGFFCGVTAAGLLGVPLPWRVADDTDLHVGVVSPSRAPRVAGVVGHKYVIPSHELMTLRDLPITTPERTFCDLAVSLGVPDLVAAGDYMVQWRSPLTSIAAMSDMTRRHPNRDGRARRAAAVALLDERAESPGESRLRVVLVRGGVTGFICNAPIAVPRASYRGDIVFPRERVVVEYEGGYHHDRNQWCRDMSRISRLEAAGWIVVRVNARDLDDPTELVARIRSVLASRHA